MADLDQTGRNLRAALVSMRVVATNLQAKKISISPELRTTARSLQEQAEWFEDAIKDPREWDVSGMEDCIKYMESNVRKLETSDHKLIVKCAKKYERVTKCWKACEGDMVEFTPRGPEEIEVEHGDDVVFHIVAVNDREDQPHRILNTFVQGALRFYWGHHMPVHLEDDFIHEINYSLYNSAKQQGPPHLHQLLVFSNGDKRWCGMIVSINDEDLGMLQKIKSLQANLEDDDEMIRELRSLAYLEEDLEEEN